MGVKATALAHIGGDIAVTPKAAKCSGYFAVTTVMS
jgi:hypothetical protein